MCIAKGRRNNSKSNSLSKSRDKKSRDRREDPSQYGKGIPLLEPSYKDLNTRLQFPNNPAYFTMKRVDVNSTQ